MEFPGISGTDIEALQTHLSAKCLKEIQAAEERAFVYFQDTYAENPADRSGPYLVTTRPVSEEPHSCESK